MQESILKDLEIQWMDHWDIRSQTWKTLNNTTLFFLAVVIIDFKNMDNWIMVVLYVSVFVISFMSYNITKHHRLRQKQKFDFIKMYEEKLGLLKLKSEIIIKSDEQNKKHSFLAMSVFSTKFIEFVNIAIMLISSIMIFNKLN